MSLTDMLMIQAVNETKSAGYRAYFRAHQTLRNTSLMAPPELRISYFTSVPFCRLACLVINERIDLASVDAETDEATAFLTQVLKVNGGADMVAQAHLVAMEYGRAYLVPTGSDREDGSPMIQVVPGMDMVHRVDGYTGEITEALQVFGELRDRYVYWSRNERVTAIRRLGPDSPQSTVMYDEVPEGFTTDARYPGFYVQIEASDVIPIFPLICRGEPGNTFGRPEAKDAFKLQDKACREATDMSIASAAMGTPQRLLIGAEAEDFGDHDPDGNPVEGTEPSAESLYLARLLTISDPAAKVAEFTAAQLQNFATALNTSSRLASAALGVPMSVFGIASDANPASGDAKAEDDKRLIRRAEQLTRGFEPGWIGLFTYLLRANGFGAQDVRLRFVDPSLPNLSGRADAVLKLSQVKDFQNQPLYTWQELRRKLGDSEDEIKAAEDERETMGIQGLLTEPEPAQNATQGQETGSQNEPGTSPQGG